MLVSVCSFFVFLFLQNETEAERRENVSKGEGQRIQEGGHGNERKGKWGGNRVRVRGRCKLGTPFLGYVLFQARGRKLSSLQEQGRVGAGGR